MFESMLSTRVNKLNGWDGFTRVQADTGHPASTIFDGVFIRLDYGNLAQRGTDDILVVSHVTNYDDADSLAALFYLVGTNDNRVEWFAADGSAHGTVDGARITFDTVLPVDKRERCLQLFRVWFARLPLEKKEDKELLARFSRLRKPLKPIARR